jgi:hypothetical protein
LIEEKEAALYKERSIGIEIHKHTNLPESKNHQQFEKNSEPDTGSLMEENVS